MNKWAKSQIDAGKQIMVVYMPATYPTIPRPVMESFIEMIRQEILDELDKIYNVKLCTVISTKFPLDYSRNEMIDRSVSDYGATYLMMCDSDNVWPPDTLLRLMALISDETPVATGVYFTKANHYHAVMGKYNPWSEDLEKKRGSLTEQGFIAPDGTQTLYFKHMKEFDIVEPIDVFGLGGVLFRTDVFKKLKKPYCKYVNGYSTQGDFTFINHSEDMWLCSELKKAGIKTICDPTLRYGHVAMKVIGTNEQ